MKKFVLALMFLMSTVALSFAGTINYYNQTGDNIQFLRDGNPVGYQVIPNGFYSETVPNGNYHLAATNGQQTTSGYDCTIEAANARCDYRVFVQQGYMSPFGARVVAVQLHDVALLNYGRFTVNTPVELTKGEQTNGTTNAGAAYTSTVWQTDLANGDSYLVSVADYPFQTVQEDLDKAVKGFANGTNGTITKQQPLTVSGQPAVAAVIEMTKAGHTYRSAVVITIKGNSAYMFVFVTDVATPGTDMNAVTEFFNSIRLN